MNETNELKALRFIREINIAIRELENQSSATSKRYKKGVKMLQKEICSVEALLDDGAIIEGTEPWVILTQQLRSLIFNPTLSNIEEDNSI
jgi:hypothetical protein